MKLASEADILQESVRAQIIQEIKSAENLKRKQEALKAYDVFKDFTRKYVVDRLALELEPETVEEMKSRASNVSICKKIVNKKARIYKKGAVREVFSELELSETKQAEEQGKIDKLYDQLKANQVMKKANRFLELRKNTLVQVIPIEEDNDLFSLKLRALPDFLYDVIEDGRDPERMLAYVTSSFTQRDLSQSAAIDDSGRGELGFRNTNFRSGDGKDQKLADAQADESQGNEEYVWWSKNYHFTTNAKGQVLNDKSPEDLLNPIGMMNAVSLNKDQDGSYWAVGGEDLIDSSILINVLLTDMYFIGKIQGMGIFYLFGKNIEKRLKIGANRGITVEMEEGDPTPQIGFANSNPPLDQHMRMIEQAMALLLSTNDLASNTVQGKLDANNMASGISELIVRSEVVSAIEDEQEMFYNAEPELFKIIRAFHNLYFDKKLLIDPLQSIGQIDEAVSIKPEFTPVQEFMTEEQKLNVIEKRKALGLDTMLDALMRDNPNLDEKEAEAKLLRILNEKKEMSKMFGFDNEEEEEEVEDGGESNQES